MEQTSAACAMDWSIQLQKSFRSQIPGKYVKALEEIGRRLERWNREPKLTFAEYKIFGLIPGEDKLFLNAIFLRLADAFRSGSKQIKNCVVRIFLRMKKRGKRDREGVLRKEKLDNYLELLSRVKEVYDKGDAEERSLALLLLGCWANLAKDCPDMQYIVLSSLVAGDVLEVKAAYFAAGCFSEMSDDFASVFLEILTTTVSSRKISKDIKLAAGRAFTKMWCSFTIAEKAYKIGLKLLMDSSEDDYSAIMLMSLSRIASRWMLLVPTQMELLMLFQGEDRSLHVQVTALRCFHFMLARGGVSTFSLSTCTVLKLFDMLDKSELQPTLQLEYLRILYKILLINVSIIPCMEIPEMFQKLFLVIKNMLQSSVQSNRVLAINIIADLSEKVVGRQDMWSGGSASGCTLASQVISFVLDQVLSLLTAKNGINLTDYAVELEIRSLLKALFNLVGKNSKLHCLVLSNVCLFVCDLLKMIDRAMDSDKTVMSIPEMTESGLTLVESKVILSLTKIMAACLENLECFDAETSHALDSLKLQVETVYHSSYMGSYTRLMNFLFLHLRSAFICMKNMTENLMSCNNSCLFGVDSIFELDKNILNCAKEMLERKNYWCTYKGGKNAACQGAWSTAGFIFEQLMNSVQSSSCIGWLKSLAQFSSSEHQVQLFLLSGQGTFTVPGGSGLREMCVSTLRTRSCKYMENLLRGSHAILCAEEILGAPDMGNIFSFQRWFLILRSKGLKYVADMMKLLDSVLSIQEGTRSGVELDRGTLSSCTTSWTLGPIIKTCMEVSSHMQQLAEEFDLLLTSFVGMDQQSVMSVSALALSCSIMAFTAGYAFLVSDSYSPENYRVPESGYLEGPLHALLIEDLLGRLKHIDCKTRKNLLLLLKPFRNSNRCSLSRFRTQTCYYETEVLHKLCEFSVGEVCSLRNEAARTQDADALYRILNNGSELLMKIISNLMTIPFHTPQHFFRVRSAVSSELFVMNEDGQVLDGSSISLGSPLSLNLSFQLKNMPAGLPFATKKVYCVLSCTPHSSITTKVGDSKEQARLRKQEDEMHNRMELNKELLQYVTTGRSGRRRDDCCLKVTEYACFELNEGGQGFSTCFLDISVVAVGDYRITWHCGYIDSGGSYCTLLPVNDGPFITIENDINV